jgi:hypothetical protein
MDREHRRSGGGDGSGAGGGGSPVPGKRALTDSLGPRAVQRKARGPASEDDVQATASAGVDGASAPLPHLGAIQAGFGADHDVSGVRAQVGGEGAEAAEAIGAEAYATGDRVAFRDEPDLHTAAHEAAHVVQQRAGVHLKGGLGDSEDIYERHADRVADAVVRGESAAPLLAEHAGGGGGPAVQRLELRGGERERETSGDELERRVGTHGGGEDGSGAWGAEADDRGVTDRANHYMWTRVALAAEGMGLTNAARHMRHYLGNTGATLIINPDNMMRDVEPLRMAFDVQVAHAQATVNERIAAMGDNVTAANYVLTGERHSDVYCSQSISADWFYAVGGFTYWYTAEVAVTPVADGPPRITMIFTLHVHDRYNWDQGKQVQIAGITVTDEQLGRLHRVGLAQEYDVEGTATPRDITWTYAPASPTTVSGNAPTGGARDGGRTDPSRERGRHFDNVRGSEPAGG